MLKVEKYKENLRKLEEKYKDNKNSEYFKERVNLLVSDLEPQFPKDIAFYTHCIALDLTNGEGDFKYPKEVKDYFDVRGNNNEIGPSSRFDCHLINESSYNVDKCHQDNNIDIDDLQYINSELNDLYEIGQNLGIFKNPRHCSFRKPIPYFIQEAQQRCFEHIELLALPDGIEYRELEKYCKIKVKNYKNPIPYHTWIYDVLGNSSKYYLDELVTFPKSIICTIGDELWKVEQKRHITKLKKYSWEYYQFEFEYLRIFFDSYCREYFDYVDEVRQMCFDDFLALSVFFITNGKCLKMDYDWNDIYLDDELEFEHKEDYLDDELEFEYEEDYFYCGLEFEYEEKDYFDDENMNKPKIPAINCIRYFWYNLNYLYYSISNNKIFTGGQKAYLRKYAENILNGISELIHTQGWY